MKNMLKRQRLKQKRNTRLKNQNIENHHYSPHQKVEDEKPSDEPVVLGSNYPTYPTYPTVPIPYVSSVIGNPCSFKMPLTIGPSCSFIDVVIMDFKLISLLAISLRRL